MDFASGYNNRLTLARPPARRERMIRRLFRLWPYGARTVIVDGDTFRIPRWVLNGLCKSHEHELDLDDVVGRVNEWMVEADCLHEIESEQHLLSEMPLGELRLAARASVDAASELSKVGSACINMLEHVSNLTARVEFDFGKRKDRHVTANEWQRLKPVLDDLHFASGFRSEG